MWMTFQLKEKKNTDEKKQDRLEKVIIIYIAIKQSKGKLYAICSSENVSFARMNFFSICVQKDSMGIYIRSKTNRSQ